MGKFSKSSGELSKAGKCTILFLSIVNVIFIIFGIITIAIGGYAIANGEDFAFVTGSTLIGGAVVLILAGIAIVGIAAFGFLAALCRSRIMLGIYAIVVAIIVIIEFAVGVAAFAFREQLAGFIQEGIQENFIENYDFTDASSPRNDIVDFFQGTFQCCGFDNASDWVNLNLDAITNNMNERPPNCIDCDPSSDDNCATFSYVVNATIEGVSSLETRSFNTTNVGCMSVNSNALLALYIGAGVVGIIIGILEIFGIVLALVLICCISRSKEQTVV